jgi:2-polyprenyl-3-methyl-5-hydroxy-6-metoxy-1,4-benzoquinol methylase
MFLSCRSGQAEYLDAPHRSRLEVASSYRQLGRVNWLFRFAHPFEYFLPHRLGRERCRELELLDLGAGDGALGRHLARWAQRRGWRWRVTDLDVNLLALTLSNHGGKIAGSVLSLPFCDGSFDAVIASQMTHHLANDQQIVEHFREAWRVTRDVLILSDLHRNAALYALVWFGTIVSGCSREMRTDGLVSVKRGFRRHEWRAFAARAGIPSARVSLYLGARILLDARKARPIRSGSA